MCRTPIRMKTTDPAPLPPHSLHCLTSRNFVDLLGTLLRVHISKFVSFYAPCQWREVVSLRMFVCLPMCLPMYLPLFLKWHRRIHQFFFRESQFFFVYFLIFLKSTHFNMAAYTNYKICSQCHIRGSNPFYGVCNECNEYKMSSSSIRNEDNPSKTTILS